MKKINLSGAYPPMPTPFDVQGALVVEELKANIGIWNQFELNGLLVLGSNGEFVMMDEDEKVQAIDASKQAIASDKILLAGTGCNTTQDTIRLSKRAEKSGADALLVIHPHYYKGLMSDAALKAFYTDVADAVTIPVLIYNMPGCTGMDLSADLLIELSKHENIIGWKDSGSNLVKMEAVIKAAPDFQLLIGSASLLLPALSIGAAGGIMALANIAPRQCIDMIRLFHSGAISEARELQLSMTPVNNAVTGTYGVPGLKYVMDAMGLYGGPCRKPIMETSDAGRKKLDAIIAEAGIQPFLKMA
ncbi:MAG: dihydrodipicolinate synthase family protein [Flavobacteriales bacterium]|nr:dihydrodipicolinate synthase family protein [Flavobacteriales bacterium]